MMRGFLLRWGYQVQKFKPACANDHSFYKYKKDLRSARKQVHIQAIEYQNAIEDEYLRQHQTLMEQKHRERQGAFRKACFLESYRLWKDAQKTRRENEKWEGKVNESLQGEEVRRINRSRILKIMEHESANYWFNAQNVDERLGESTIFPEYIAATEYYYKLFAEALAYEVGDFEQLHVVTSNQEIIREKNKKLIPLYVDLRGQIAEYKGEPVLEEKQRHAQVMGRLQKLKTQQAEEKQEMIEAENKRHEELLKEAEAKVSKGIQGLKRWVAAMVKILRTWKEYTNILSLTSAQVLTNQQGKEDEFFISKTEGEVENDLKNREGQGFVDSIEEDTEENEVPFEEFRDKIKQDRRDTEIQGEESAGLEELNLLMAELRKSQPINADQNSQTARQQQEIDYTEVLDITVDTGLGQADEIEVEVDPEFLNPRETTASVEILKQALKEDPEAQKLLDQLGEIDVRYPRLLQDIWRTVQS